MASVTCVNDEYLLGNDLEGDTQSICWCHGDVRLYRLRNPSDTLARITINCHDILTAKSVLALASTVIPVGRLWELSERPLLSVTCTPTCKVRFLYSSREIPTFRKNLLPPSSGWKIEAAFSKALYTFYQTTVPEDSNHYFLFLSFCLYLFIFIFVGPCISPRIWSIRPHVSSTKLLKRDSDRI
jgi:hypothetical protein